MTKSDLIDVLCETQKMPKGRAELLVKVIFDSMEASLRRGERIEIRGFGSFEIREYRAYEGRNPRTGVRRQPSSRSGCPSSRSARSSRSASTRAGARRAARQADRRRPVPAPVSSTGSDRRQRRDGHDRAGRRHRRPRHGLTARGTLFQPRDFARKPSRSASAVEARAGARARGARRRSAWRASAASSAPLRSASTSEPETRAAYSSCTARSNMISESQ